MKNIKDVIRRGNWLLHSFPKHDTTIIYNSETKTVDVMKGAVTDTVDVKEVKSSKTNQVDLLSLVHDWKRISIILAVGWVVIGVCVLAAVFFS